jgi:hypothetical protein
MKMIPLSKPDMGRLDMSTPRGKTETQNPPKQFDIFLRPEVVDELDLGDVSVGDMVTLHARARVTRVAESEDGRGLQVDLAVERIGCACDQGEDYDEAFESEDAGDGEED